ncbi:MULTISPECIES: hypothetical protein [Prochlorococcus]|uniref:Uncharacterized protein n=1 Tax=Prochlorococcus marinus (strain SARG / CCMP1375 / SS120) TaxID=167539 RepID=Q7VDG2_PROMA|nr:MULTISPECIES: hypothetical protein [Prochlorococcus]AAP99460.1 Predicted protein [Prochlorococcus marinus subsp. marinus str. CCMP1375]KGG11272.1 hypothetical protein EV04_1348 [Prochlorococcus marinus str. LG]KGG21611.1 hypothetical protein EV08_0700 [Prochlorococcus marinus str. SS2]KGG23047.1 hypothetical protein EV09_1792 [Prochlorococcus marinus str. SS35]KGG33754.1 hypothetical protein EV10_0191 [Prochlorococcus marinus str. SS51]
MVELTLMVLLNTVGDQFCAYRSEGSDTYKSLLLAYSDASEKYGVKEVRNVIKDSDALNFSAVAIALLKCPQHIK